MNKQPLHSQAAFAQALLDPDAPCPPGLRSHKHSDTAARFAVYRNNVLVSLVDALADTFPVVQALVGDPFFQAMARVFARAQPPQSPVLARYGDQFPDFVARFPPAATLPYLADVARLEMARVVALHSADTPALPAAALQAVLAQPALLAQARAVLHPSVHLVRSQFAVYSLWAAHQEGGDIHTVNPALAETALVLRHGLMLQTVPLDSAHAALIAALHRGDTLLDAVDSAQQAAHRQQLDFDPAQALADVLRWQLLTQLHTP